MPPARTRPPPRRALLAALAAVALGLAWLASRQDPIDSAVERLLADTGMPGAVVAFGRAGDSPRVRAYGSADPATGTPMTVSDRLKLASLSKPITAETILALVRAGALELDSRLVDVVPDAAGAADPRVASITVRHLLQHSAGWDRAVAGDLFFLGAAELARLVGPDAAGGADCDRIAVALLRLPLQFDPGARYAYSNVGYCWLGRIVAAVHGAPYEEAVRALLPEAAGASLDASTVTVRHEVAARERDYLVNRPDAIGAAGGWIAGAADYFRFAARPVDPRVLERPDYASGVEHYGLGWRVWRLDGGVVLTHFGAMPGTFSVVVRRIDGPILVALFNGRPPDDEAALARLMRAVVPGSGPRD